jgi:prolyl-tRNA editing enzyme YbaK/EbsC (Cys-tRNA(Pro) deacylase)
MENHPKVQAVRDALDAAGARTAAGETPQVVILDEAVHTAAAAAAALGVDAAQIANSLIFDADGEPLLVLTSGGHRVDAAKLAADLGIGKLRRATPEFVREHTGQAIGGVAPVGHPKPIRTVVDRTLAQYPQIWAGAGVPQAVVPFTYAELVRITDGTAADVA